VDDISITNGTIIPHSFTRVNATEYIIIVTPNLGGKHSNVGITVAANSFTDIARVGAVMVNSQFSVSTISSSCDKITQMRSSAIPYQ
jgi:ABC-type branched-subunit amino acid transport system permease subunit